MTELRFLNSDGGEGNVDSWWGWGGDCDCVQVVNSDGIRDVDRQKY